MSSGVPKGRRVSRQKIKLQVGLDGFYSSKHSETQVWKCLGEAPGETELVRPVGSHCDHSFSGGNWICVNGGKRQKQRGAGT